MSHCSNPFASFDRQLSVRWVARLLKGVQPARRLDAPLPQPSGAYSVSCNASNAAAVAAAGGIALLLGALTRFTDDALIACSSCGALRNIARNWPSRCGAAAAVAAASGIAALVGALRRHRSNADVVERACHALRSIVLSTPAWASAAAAFALLDAVVEGHAPADAVPADAVFAAAAACATEGEADHSAALVAAGGIDAVVSALTACGTAAKAAEQCCLLLQMLASNDANRAAIVDAHGAPALLVAMASAARGDGRAQQGQPNLSGGLQRVEPSEAFLRLAQQRAGKRSLNPAAGRHFQRADYHVWQGTLLFDSLHFCSACTSPREMTTTRWVTHFD